MIVQTNTLPRTVQNLNRVKIRASHSGRVPLSDYSCISQACKVEVVFRNHKERLLRLLQNYSRVFGCIAWLTDFEILDSLRDKQVSIVVQKEDLLRPDFTAEQQADIDSELDAYYSHEGIIDVMANARCTDWEWNQKLKTKYIAINSSHANNETHYVMPAPLCKMTVSDTQGFWGIRCMGNNNSAKNRTVPLMHNKFLVLTNYKGVGHDWDNEDESNSRFLTEDSCVWTGSCNLSINSTRSLENAVILHDNNIVCSYLNEYAQIMALSEPIDWESMFCTPENQIVLKPRE